MDEFLEAFAQRAESPLAALFLLADALYFHSPDPIVFVDDSGSIVSLNEAARRSIVENITGKLWVESLVAPGYSEEAKLFETKRQLDKDLSDPLITVILCQDGRQIEVEVRHRALGAQTGVSVLRLLFLRDISARESLARMLVDANKALSAATASKTDFIATVSHEIRTAVNGMMGTSEYLLDEDMTVDQKARVRKLYLSGKMLVSLVNDVLDYAKTESGQLRLEEVDYQLRECLDETVSVVADAAFDKGVELVSKLNPALPCVVCGDSMRLRQIITNLVSNSIKFTSSGNIVVSAFPVGFRQVDAQEWCDVQFEVLDTGAGMTPETQQQLFQPFVQAERSTARVYGGTGLGLAICKSLVERMGGHISVFSDGVGHGSKFTFQIPMLVKLRSPPQQPNFVGKRVLLASRNPTLLDAVVQIMSEFEGLSSRTAMSPGEAAALDAEQHFDAVVLDSSLALSFDQQFIAERVIVLTEVSLIAQLKRVLTDRVQYVSKPVTQDAIVAAFAAIFAETSTLYVSSMISPSPPPTLRKPLHVLVADDNIVNQEVALLFLKRAGCTVDLANNGLEAVKLVQSTAALQPYDVILMDLRMPELDGLSAAKLIRKLPPPLCDVRIVALTASVLDEEEQTCLAAGMNACLSKPFTGRNFYRALSGTSDEEKQVSASAATYTDGAAVIPRLDVSVLEAMCDNDEATMAQLLAVFRGDMRQHRLALNAAHATALAGLKEMARTAHTLRGASSGVGAKRLANWCRSVEQHVNRSADELVKVFENTTVEIAAVQTRIEREM